ncbi:MAG: O-antigen ligase family protein [Xenococcus sp. (in: cyanobacteria)]
MSASSQAQFIIHLKRLETGIVILILLYSSGIWWHVQSINRTEAGSPGSGLKTIINLGIYLFTFLSIAANWKRFFYVITRDKLFLLLIGIALLSIFWSANPEKSIWISKGLIRVTFFGTYLVTRYSLKEQLRLYAWTFGLASLLSLALCLAIPSQGIQAAWGGEIAGWRGVFYHKNHLGRLMVFSSGIFLLLALSSHKYRWVLATGFSLSLSLLLLSNSKTALLGFLLMLILFPLWLILRAKSYNLRMLLLHIALLLIGAIFVTILGYAEPILSFMGKEPTLTGRIPLWTILLENLVKKPFLGYGYEGFWSSYEGSEVRAQLSWAGHAHSGFLEVALSLGLFGFSILVLGLLRNYFRAINYARLATTVEGLWPIQVLTTTIFVNLTVGSTFLATNVFWMLYVTTSLSLALQRDRQKRNISRS